MPICNDLWTIGKTFETNLNNRGVNCTFGKNTGEQSIYDMAKLINEQNLMGIGDTNIQIIPNRPYATNEETIDITIRLLDGIGNPLSNKTIIINDGTNSYNGMTDNNGIYTLFNQTITTDTTYTVSYGTEIASRTIPTPKFIDYGVTDNHNDNWYKTSGTDNRTVTNTGTILGNTTNIRYDIFAYFGVSNEIYVFQPPFTVEMDIMGSNSGTDTRFQIYDNVTKDVYNGDINSNGHWKIVYDGTTVKPYYNGVEQTNYTRNMPNARIGFIIPEMCVIMYKNFVIY